MHPLWFLRMARWARNPPPLKRVLLVFGIIAVGLILVGIEQFIGWPDALTVNNTPTRSGLRP